MKTRLNLIILIHLAAAVTLGQDVKSPIQFHGGTEVWDVGPATLPAGTKRLVLEGDPRNEGLFTMRIKVPASSRIQPHFHPSDERVTILSGRVAVGFGDVFDETAMKSFGPGSFYVNPALSHHYVLIVEEAVMQITGMGPWQLRMVERPIMRKE